MPGGAEAGSSHNSEPAGALSLLLVFDLGDQFDFIEYQFVDDARKRLYGRTIAIEGEGPHVPNAGTRGGHV